MEEQKELIAMDEKRYSSKTRRELKKAGQIEGGALFPSPLAHHSTNRECKEDARLTASRLAADLHRVGSKADEATSLAGLHHPIPSPSFAMQHSHTLQLFGEIQCYSQREVHIQAFHTRETVVSAYF